MGSCSLVPDPAPDMLLQDLVPSDLVRESAVLDLFLDLVLDLVLELFPDLVLDPRAGSALHQGVSQARMDMDRQAAPPLFFQLAAPRFSL